MVGLDGPWPMGSQSVKHHRVVVFFTGNLATKWLGGMRSPPSSQKGSFGGGSSHLDPLANCVDRKSPKIGSAKTSKNRL